MGQGGMHEPWKTVVLLLERHRGRSPDINWQIVREVQFVVSQQPAIDSHQA